MNASHEFAQMIQSILSGNTSHYDYRDPNKNFIVYNQTEAPNYQFDKISLKTISIWYGESDSSVPPKAINRLLKLMKGESLQRLIAAALRLTGDRTNATITISSVPVEKHFYNQSDVYFNHVSYLFHKNIANLLVIPALMRLESGSET